MTEGCGGLRTEGGERPTPSTPVGRVKSTFKRLILNMVIATCG